MRCPERSLQLQNMGYQKQETSEKEHSEQHVCHFSAANAFDYELCKMYEWYRLMVQSLEVHIHSNPMEKKEGCMPENHKEARLFSFEYANKLINSPSKNHLHNLGATARASCEDFNSKQHQQQLINSHILKPNCTCQKCQVHFSCINSYI